ncbi:TIM barrel protein [Aquisphaera insulae]|uniref:TIM barrel protein n=1 Tax=Aquisphaera insulae TaxID=2712864 RepID=UPI0013EBA159|nr:TIM barrel protein [Aquisphaera insulae]
MYPQGRRSGLGVSAGLAVAWLVVLAPSVGLGDEPGPVRRVYAHLLDPREHPDDDRRAVKPPGWGTFGDRTRFTCLRGFNVQDGAIVGHREELDRYTRTHELGEVIWPSYPILFAKNLGDLADEIRNRGLFLFDVWGYVPGSGPGGYWTQFRPDPGVFRLLESKLGDHWLGTDIGEQDGRYIGGYASQMTPSSASRREQYLNFQRHFERMSDDLGHKHATLVSLNFGHYLLREGTFTLIGAETAQGLPNNQVYYAFIRGAGKQYGVPWFGNASVYNRWGYKSYDSTGPDHGPTKGASLSLLRRLLYWHILANCMTVGFESGWLQGNDLSPIGKVQQNARRWVQRHGQPGVMLTPVALLLDQDAGWTFPRHLYTSEVYRVWGNLPYDEGDYLTDAILGLIYPRYQDSSFFHDETGFLAPTPHGDLADCLLSDAPGWLLRRYPVVILAGALQGGREVSDRLTAYVEQGGHLVLTAGNLPRLSKGFCGLAEIRANATGVTEKSCGAGRVTLIHSPWGMEPEFAGRPPKSEEDRPLPKPYRMQQAAEEAIRSALDGQRLLDVGNANLAFITCRKARGEYTLGIANNTWHEQAFRIASRCGAIESIEELAIADGASSSPGYAPEGIDSASLGRSGDGRIAGGDVRIFRVKVKETGVEEIADVPPSPRPRNRLLPLRGMSPIKEEVLARPTFFQHFDGVIVDYRYLHDRDRRALRREAGWIARQGLAVWVDLSSGINLYPGLRLVDNSAQDYADSLAVIADVQEKMAILGARDLVVSGHRHPENNMTDEQARASFAATLRTIGEKAASGGRRVHLRIAPGKPPWGLAEAARLIDGVGLANLDLAPDLALLEEQRPDDEAVKGWIGKVGAWMAASSRKDVAGRPWDAHAPIHRADASGDTIRRWLALAPARPIVLDGIYPSQDDEYLDATMLDRWERPVPTGDGPQVRKVKP